SGSSEFGGITNFPERLSEGDEVWCRCRTFMPNGFDLTAPGFALKFIRIHTSDGDDDSNTGYIDLYIRANGTYFYQSEVVPGQANENIVTDDTVQFGVWETYECYVYFSPTTPLYRVWKNGELIHESSSFITLRQSNDY